MLHNMLKNTTSSRYVTVKVRVEDEEAMQRTLFDLTDSQGLLTDCAELYFRVPSGQLKLRLAHPGKDIGTLISSSRHTNHPRRPNLCEVRTAFVHSGANQLRHTLALCLEELTVLHKKRRTFTLGKCVLIHLDNVEGLGCFLDIEVHPPPGPLAPLASPETPDPLFAHADQLLHRLNLTNSALVPLSYLELFLRRDEDSDESAFSDGSSVAQ